MRYLKLIIFGLTFIQGINLSAQKIQPVELGQVGWTRDLDQGQELSKKLNKPILILFQEVPGCSTCQRYGQGTLSHPLIVETIENYFIPVAIYNNKGGKDGEALKYFNEPTWNNPVVRVVDENRKDIVKRLAGNYSPEGLVQTLMSGMTKTGQEILNYLNLLNQELSIGHAETAVYSMYCFWTGESHFGRKEGVVATEPGFANGHEVVKVVYDPTVIDKKELDRYAEQSSCSLVKDPKGYRIDKEPKYYMSKTNYRYIPMTPLQQTRVNGALGKKQDPRVFLSPNQLQLLDTINQNTNHNYTSVIETPFEDAWRSVF